MKVLLIIPAFNEEESIVENVTHVIEYSKTVDYQLDYVVINDGSTDNTKKLLENNQMNAVNLIMNLGIGGAVQTGYKYAQRHDYDIAIQFDGDGQHDVRSLENLLEPILSGNADMVIGSRFVGEKLSEFQTSFMRRLGIRLISAMIKISTGHRIWDTTSGYRLVNKAVIAKFSKRYPIKYPEPESTVHLLKQGYEVVEVAANMFERQGGESSITPLKSVKYMFEVCSSILIASLMKEGE